MNDKELWLTTDLATADSNTTVLEMSVLPKVTYSSTAELVLSIILCIVSTVWICGAHGIIMYCVWHYPILHSPINYIVAAYSANDISLNVSCNLMVIYALALGGKPAAQWTCNVHGSSAVGIFFAICYIIAVMAYERYRYFVHPLTHSTLFSPRRTVGIIAIALGIPYLYSIATEIAIGRMYHQSILSCHLPGTVILNYIQLVGFFFPSMLVTVYSMIRIWHVAMASRVAPADAETNTANVSHRDRIRVGLKAIVMVSGAFWGTYIPAFALRTYLFSSGYTWDDMDTRRTMGAAIGIRITQFLFVQTSSAANPVIYYHTNKMMRVAVCKTLGWKIPNQDDGQLTSSSTA